MNTDEQAKGRLQAWSMGQAVSGAAPATPGRAHAELLRGMLLLRVMASSSFIDSLNFSRHMPSRTPQHVCLSVFICGSIFILVNPGLKPQVIHFDIAQYADLAGEPFIVRDA